MSFLDFCLDVAGKCLDGADKINTDFIKKHGHQMPSEKLNKLEDSLATGREYRQSIKDLQDSRQRSNEEPADCENVEEMELNRNYDLACAGDADAQFYIGSYLLNMVEEQSAASPKDSEALNFLRQAARQGNVSASGRLCVYLFDKALKTRGKGGQQCFVLESLKHAKIAAAAGDPCAISLLTTLRDKGYNIDDIIKNQGKGIDFDSDNTDDESTNDVPESNSKVSNESDNLSYNQPDETSGAIKEPSHSDSAENNTAEFVRGVFLLTESKSKTSLSFSEDTDVNGAAPPWNRFIKRAAMNGECDSYATLDDSEAIKLLSNAAKNGHIGAASMLGVYLMLKAGWANGMRRNRFVLDSIDYLQQAASGNDKSSIKLLKLLKRDGYDLDAVMRNKGSGIRFHPVLGEQDDLLAKIVMLTHQRGPV